jgi:hypothetical protein
MKKVSRLMEELSGLASFWVGLLYLFIAVSMAFYIHNTADALVMIITAIWSLSLLLASRRAGYGVVLFRMVSVLVLMMGTVLAAIFLPIRRF